LVILMENTQGSVAETVRSMPPVGHGDVTPERENWRQPERDGGDDSPREHYSDESDRRSSVRDTVVDSFKAHDPDWEEPEGIRERGYEPKEKSVKPRERPALREPQVEEAAGAEQDTAKSAAPTSWSKASKEIWRDLPETARREIMRREKDMEKGVKQLKDRYQDLESACTPEFKQACADFNKTPGQAFAQMHAWYTSLAKNPDVTWPALIKSYGYDPRRIIESFYPGAIAEHQWMQNVLRQAWGDQVYQQALQQAHGRHAQQQRQQQVYNRQYQDAVNRGVQQRMDPYLQQQRAENVRRTEEYLNDWASGKPHFEKVRVLMGHLLTPDPETGQAAVPLVDNKIDLDTAYERACWMDPETRQKILREQEREKARAQRDYQNKLAAGSSISSSAPGSSVGRPTAPKSRGLSVRQSLFEAVDELRSR
jgi:hypothetical protein